MACRRTAYGILVRIPVRPNMRSDGHTADRSPQARRGNRGDANRPLVPDRLQPGTVLAPVKAAARRLRRWALTDPALTAAARSAFARLQVGTKKRPVVEQRNYTVMLMIPLTQSEPYEAGRGGYARWDFPSLCSSYAVRHDVWSVSRKVSVSPLSPPLPLSGARSMRKEVKVKLAPLRATLPAA